MSEERLNSNTLDIEQRKRLSDGKEELKESYRPISEDSGLDHVSEEAKSSNATAMVRENGDAAQDGADEKMLGSDDKESLALKNIEVKFISGEQNTNGDAKIDIGNIEKQQPFTGMTKEELMKYANDPFWVRLRWILFILFWAVWILMLVGAISIIVFAAKCSAPTPLVWWKRGPLITITGNENAEEINAIKNVNAKGVIYELSADETYLVDTPAVENRIKELVEKYKADEIHVVLDLTPNFVKETDPLFQSVIADTPNKDNLNAFVHSVAENNWKKVGSSTPAWKKVKTTYFLSQFGDNIDLNMHNSVAQEKLIGVIRHLVDIGVKGFRLNNAKHLLVNMDLKDEVNTASPTNYVVGEYGFYNHHQTTYREGLGDVLHIFSNAVFNATNGEGFLTIRDDASHLDKLKLNGTNIIGVPIPRFDFINQYLKTSADNAKRLHTGFSAISNDGVDVSSLWMQIEFNQKDTEDIGVPAYNLFTSLLPGVQISSLDLLKFDNSSYDKIQSVRDSPVFQQGNFNFTLSANNTAFGYIRVKSGHPGYFVAVNPSDSDIDADFKSELLSSELSVFVRSDGFDETQKSIIHVDKVPLAKRSAAIFTFVPKN